MRFCYLNEEANLNEKNNNRYCLDLCFSKEVGTLKFHLFLPLIYILYSFFRFGENQWFISIKKQDIQNLPSGFRETLIELFVVKITIAAVGLILWELYTIVCSSPS